MYNNKFLIHNSLLHKNIYRWAGTPYFRSINEGITFGTIEELLKFDQRPNPIFRTQNLMNKAVVLLINNVILKKYFDLS